MIRPITPKEAISRRTVPQPVIYAFNKLIKKHLINGKATIGQREVVSAICERITKERTSHRSIEETIFKEHWLDVEDIYRSAGWKVDYDKPGYNETYEPTFTFTAKIGICKTT